MTSTLSEPLVQEVTEGETIGPAEWIDNRRLLLISAWTLVGLFVLGALLALYFGQAAFFPIVLAVILKLVFSPVVRRLNRWHVPNFVAAGLVVGGILALALAAILFLSGPASAWIDDAPQHFRTVEYKLRSLKEPIAKVNNAGERVEELTEVEGQNRPLSVEIKQPGMSSLVLNTTGEVMVGAFLTLVTLYFLLAGGDRFLEKLVSVTPEWGDKKRIVAVAREIQQCMSSYLLHTTYINIGLGIVIGLGMWIVGLPNPVLWGVMAACLNYMPYFGCIVGGGIVFLVGLISLESLAQAAWAPTIYFAANGIEGYFITPSILGRSISLSPLAIVISMILWGWLWGVGGMLIAVPMLAAAKIACDHIGPLEPLGQLLGR